jgi:hypothetical protein
MDSVLINIISLQEHCKERVIGMVEEMKRVRSIKWRFEEGIYGKYIRSVPTIEEKIERLHYTNTQLLWANDNFKKGKKQLNQRGLI